MMHGKIHTSHHRGRTSSHSMLVLRLPGGSFIPLKVGEKVPVGREHLGGCWGLFVSRVQFVAKLGVQAGTPQTDQSLMQPCVEVMSRGKVNKTVVTVGKESRERILNDGDSQALQAGDLINLENQDPLLAISVAEASQSPKRGRKKAVARRRPRVFLGGDLEEDCEESSRGVKDILRREVMVRDDIGNAGNEPTGLLLVMVGLPGSGKSTFAQHLNQSERWSRINQDSINKGRKGTKEQCLLALSAALMEGKWCIADRVNSSPDQRRPFLEIASGRNNRAHAVVLNLKPEICVQRVIDRVDHEGNVQGKGKAHIVHMHKKSLMENGPPTLQEGFDSVWICNSPEEVDEALAFWKRVGLKKDREGQNLLLGINGQVVGSMKDWKSKKAKTPKKKKASGGRDKQESETSSQSSKSQTQSKASLGGRRGIGSSSDGKTSAIQGRETNAFAVMMNAAKRPRRMSTPTSTSKTKKGKADSNFTAGWQQPLFQRAMSPNRFKAQDPDMAVDSVCIVLKDAYPKARHHFLVVARDHHLEQVTDLRREHCETLRHMRRCAHAQVSELRKEGVEFQFGFHSKPSMRQLHMHVVSTDFDSPALKNKKHWNSFTTDFFLDIDAVLSQLEENGRVVVDDQAAQRSLKQPLQCHRCKQSCKNLVQLKTHIALCNLMSGFGGDHPN